MESGGCDTTTIRRLTHSCAFRNSLVLLVQNLMLFWNVGGAALSHAAVPGLFESVGFPTGSE
jgi:hypothetical protein